MAHKRLKERDQKAHARMRLRTRCELEGSRSEIDDAIKSMTDTIQAGRAKHIEKQSNRLGLFEVTFSKKSYYPVYDHTRKVITTFLTQEMVEQRNYNEDEM